MQSTTAVIALGLTYFASIVAAAPHAYPMPRPYPQAFSTEGDDCPVDGVMRCTAKDTWTLCDHGKLVDMGKTAEGMECLENGDGTASMVRAGFADAQVAKFTNEQAEAAAAAIETIRKLMDGTLDWSVRNPLISGSGFQVYLEPVEGWSADATTTAPTDETTGTDDTVAPAPVESTVAPAESSVAAFVTSENPTTAPVDEVVTGEEVAAAAPIESTPVESPVEVAPVEVAPVEEAVPTVDNGLWVPDVGLERRKPRENVGCMTFYVCFRPSFIFDHPLTTSRLSVSVPTTRAKLSVGFDDLVSSFFIFPRPRLDPPLASLVALFSRIPAWRFFVTLCELWYLAGASL